MNINIDRSIYVRHWTERKRHGTRRDKNLLLFYFRTDQYRDTHIHHYYWGGLFSFWTVEEMAGTVADLDQLTLEDA